jgi:hypothetical protein
MKYNILIYLVNFIKNKKKIDNNITEKGFRYWKKFYIQFINGKTYSKNNTGTLGNSKNEKFMEHYNLIDCEGYKKNIEKFNKELGEIIKDDDIIIFVENS